MTESPYCSRRKQVGVQKVWQTGPTPSNILIKIEFTSRAITFGAYYDMTNMQIYDLFIKYSVQFTCQNGILNKTYILDITAS